MVILKHTIHFTTFMFEFIRHGFYMPCGKGIICQVVIGSKGLYTLR